jgi:acylglycerol lipase
MRIIRQRIIAGCVACAAVSTLSGLSAADAQTSQGSAGTGSPSLIKQAGQVLLDRAQKGVTHTINERLQGTTTTPAATPSNPHVQSPLYGGTTGVVPASAYTPASDMQLAPYRSWVNPNEKPIACLLCIHGLGLQSNSYEFFGTEQSKRGLAVYAIDVRGFGAWSQAGGKAKVDFNQCLEDVRLALQAIRAANPGLPVYVLGESMGGAIALRAASMYPDLVDGLISSVPAGERFKQEKTSAKVFINLLSGKNVLDVGGDIVNQATQNEKLRAKWKDDPLSRLNLRPEELIQFQDFMNANHEAARKVTDMPVLIVQSNGDQLVKPEGTWQLFNEIVSKDKSFFGVPGEHLIFEEAQTQEPGPRDQNFRVISSWLSTKVGRRTRSRFPGAGVAGGAGRGTIPGMNTGAGTGANTYGRASATNTPINTTNTRTNTTNTRTNTTNTRTNTSTGTGAATTGTGPRIPKTKFESKYPGL